MATVVLAVAAVVAVSIAVPALVVAAAPTIAAFAPVITGAVGGAVSYTATKIAVNTVNERPSLEGFSPLACATNAAAGACFGQAFNIIGNAVLKLPINVESGMVGSTASNTTVGIGWTGDIGENALKQLGGDSQVYLSTSQGVRVIDQLVDGVANESKVGYTCLTSQVRLQIAKDIELINTGAIDSSVWHFYPSPITGQVGPSSPLAQALDDAGIDYLIH